MKITIKKLSSYTISLLILNSILFFIIFNLSNTGIKNLDGTYIEPKSSELMISLFKAIVFSLPILALILGLITSIFIDRQQTYKKRYPKGFLLTLIVIYGFTFLMASIRLIKLIVLN